MDATRRLLRHGSVYTLGTVLQLSAAALVVPVLAHRLSPAQYGVVALALTIQLLLSTVVGGGLSVAVTRTFYDEGPDGGAGASRRLIVSTVLVALPATAVVAL